MNRRVYLTGHRLDGRPVADAAGVAGEEFETELYAPYGLSVDIDGEGILVEVNGDANNYVCLPPVGDRVAPSKSLLLYYGKTEIELRDDVIIMRVSSGKITIDGNKITTDMDFETTGSIKALGDVTAGVISLKKHKHIGVVTGGAVSGVPVP